MRPSFQQADLLTEAWDLPVARRYRPLQPQGFSSICGPTSVANVLRSLEVKTGRNPLRGFGLRAMTLDQLVSEAAEVAPAGWRVTAVRPRSVDALRAELSAANLEHRRYVGNFVRSAIFGHGGGHHSPIGGFLEREDLAFVLDVNASYGPWLVPTEKLFEAMTAVDRSSGKARGLARFERAEGP